MILSENRYLLFGDLAEPLCYELPGLGVANAIW
jgi:hypothetical protein